MLEALMNMSVEAIIFMQFWLVYVHLLLVELATVLQRQEPRQLINQCKISGFLL